MDYGGYNEQLERLMERAEVNDSQRLSFRSDPERAIGLLEYALSRPKLRNPAAFAVNRFREGGCAPGIGRPASWQTDTGAQLRPVEPRGMTIEDAEAALRFARQHGAPAVAIAACESTLDALRSRA